MASALEVAQDFAAAVGFTRPTTLTANPSDDGRQLTELLNQAGRELASRHMWQAMNFEASFTTVATESQGTLASIIGPTQVLKRILDETIWNRTTRIPVYGPLSPKVWQGYKALTMVGPYPQYRVRNNQIIMNPVPPPGNICFFEYASKCWCTDSTGATFKRNISADTDIFIVDEDLLKAGLEWRWLRKKGLDYAQEFTSYEYLVKQAITDDKPRATLRMDEPAQQLSPGIFIPIGSWSVPPL
jgi:hypothetical protein